MEDSLRRGGPRYRGQALATVGTAIPRVVTMARMARIVFMMVWVNDWFVFNAFDGTPLGLIQAPAIFFPTTRLGPVIRHL